MADQPAELISILTGDPNLLIAGHVIPDADCLGAMLALAKGIAQTTGTEPYCALPENSVSSRLQFLVEWCQPNIASTDQCRHAPSIAVCDTAKASRVNLPDNLSQELTHHRKIINIDHHASNTLFGDINWVDSQAGSASELIFRLYETAGWRIVPTVASLLYAGIHSDTIGFSLDSTSSSALAAASELVDQGADVGRIGDLMCRSQNRSEFKLRGIVYDNTRLSATGRIAFSTVNHNEITQAGCCAADIDDQIEIPRSIDAVSMAMLFTEGDKDKVRINLRGKGTINVLSLALEFGGGGHTTAAGVVMNGTIENAVNQVIPRAEKYLDKLDLQTTED